MSCGKINRGSSVACDAIPSGGTRARLILINFRQIASIDQDVNGIITAINLLPTYVAYQFLGFRADVKKSDDVVKTTKKHQFAHNIGFAIYEVDQAQKKNIERMARGRFVAIIENRGKDGNSIEVLGKGVGLEIVGGTVRDAWVNSGIFTIQLATPGEPEFERKLPQTLGYTYEEGLIIIDNLLESSPWILATNAWNDDGIWINTETWND
jgi:hypothetical protein